MISEERIEELCWTEVDQRLRSFARAIEAEVSAPLEEKIKELEGENASIRELMNCYNLGGWTDSIRLIRERDALTLQNKHLRDALSDCIDDSVEAVNARIAAYGENYRPKVLEAMRKIVSNAYEALAIPDLSTDIIQKHDNELIERCAAECDEWRHGCDNRSMQSEGYAANKCAEAIRALASAI